MRSILYSRKGLSLVEVLIAAAILGIVAVAISSVSVYLKSNTQQYLATAESTEFVRSLSSWVLTTDACKSSFVGRSLPTGSTPLVLNGYKGFGAQATTPIQAGSMISSQLRVSRLNYFDKGPDLAKPFMYGGISLTRRVAIVSLSTETLVDLSAPRQLKTQSFELPVLVDGADTIQFCLSEMNEAQACAAQGGAINPSTGQCLAQTGCEITGTYSKPISNPASQCCGFTSDANPVTGSPSCPPGSSAQKVGQTNQTSWRTYSCGKKCDLPIYDWKEFYVCLRCGS